MMNYGEIIHIIFDMLDRIDYRREDETEIYWRGYYEGKHDALMQLLENIE